MSQQASMEDSFLLGGGVPSASFENIGDYIEGTVTKTEVTQQTDFETSEPLWWDAEQTRPRQQLVVTLQTELRDPMVEDDDGLRKLYIKGSTKAGSRSMHDATASAVRKAGAKGLKPGGWGRWSYVDSEPPQKKGMSPRKMYEAVYRAPDMEAITGNVLGTNTPAPATAPVYAAPAPVAAPVAAAPTPVAAPVAAPAPAPVAAAPAAAGPSPVDNARALIAAGVDDALIIAATSLDPAVITVLRNG